MRLGGYSLNTGHQLWYNPVKLVANSSMKLSPGSGLLALVTSAVAQVRVSRCLLSSSSFLVALMEIIANNIS